MILNDLQISELAKQGMIFPSLDKLIRQDEETSRRVISYGLSSYGYDIRLSPKEFKISKYVSLLDMIAIDPKKFDSDSLEDIKLKEDKTGTYFELPGMTYGLGVSLEHINMPDDISAICIGKSTYARCGIIANMTPVEAGWLGHLTIELTNTSKNITKIYANEGIVQLLFFKGDRCNISYNDRYGKYQGQPQKIILPVV